MGGATTTSFVSPPSPIVISHASASVVPGSVAHPSRVTPPSSIVVEPFPGTVAGTAIAPDPIPSGVAVRSARIARRRRRQCVFPIAVPGPAPTTTTATTPVPTAPLPATTPTAAATWPQQQLQRRADAEGGGRGRRRRRFRPATAAPSGAPQDALGFDFWGCFHGRHRPNIRRFHRCRLRRIGTHPAASHLAAVAGFRPLHGSVVIVGFGVHSIGTPTPGPPHPHAPIGGVRSGKRCRGAQDGGGENAAKGGDNSRLCCIGGGQRDPTQRLQLCCR